MEATHCSLRIRSGYRVGEVLYGILYDQVGGGAGGDMVGGGLWGGT